MVYFQIVLRLPFTTVTIVRFCESCFVAATLLNRVENQLYVYLSRSYLWTVEVTSKHHYPGNFSVFLCFKKEHIHMLQDHRV
jgi:hypothetical protein